MLQMVGRERASKTLFDLLTVVRVCGAFTCDFFTLRCLPTFAAVCAFVFDSHSLLVPWYSFSLPSELSFFEYLYACLLGFERSAVPVLVAEVEAEVGENPGVLAHFAQWHFH